MGHSDSSPTPPVSPKSEDAAAGDAVLLERARLLARTPDETLLASEVFEAIRFCIGPERFAVETRFVHEIVRLDEITRVPGSCDVLVGVTNLRGEILAVMNLGRLLNVTVDPDRFAWIIVMGDVGTEFGIAVETVEEVCSQRTNEILAPEKSTDDRHGLIRGVTQDAVRILNGMAILADKRLFIDDD